jgi:transcriptional regulator with XRE-family HTH domain
VSAARSAVTPAPGEPGPGIPARVPVNAREPLASLQEAIAAARKEAGGLLAGFRHTAGLSQVQLARQIGYSATVVAHAELGRRPVSPEFWELADGALGADGNLTAWGTRIKDLIQAMHEEQRRLERTGHAGRLSRLLARPGADGMAAAVPDVREPAITTPATGRCPHCRQPVTLVTQIAAPPETGASPVPPS